MDIPYFYFKEGKKDKEKRNIKISKPSIFSFQLWNTRALGDILNIFT